MKGSLARFGQHLIVGLAGSALLPEEKRLLSELRPLGIILFAKNFEKQSSRWQETLRTLLHEATDASKDDQLLIAVDHEGGRVFRFPDEVTRFPAARRWGSDAGAVGAAMGAELSALGFNLSFAPVLDVHSEPSNPVIGERAFSNDVHEAARWAEEFRAGLESRGIVSCGKHFPGHGATTQDSHKVLPRLDVSMDVLRNRELVPFAESIAAGIPMIMTAHVVYPAIDPDNPATLSEAAISRLLRGELKFNGVVITDDLEMKALGRYSPAEKATLGIRAGNDILLEANPESGLALEYAHSMAEALAKEEDRGFDFGPSRARLAKLKKLVLNTREHRSAAAHVIGCQEHRELASRLG